MNNTVRTQLLEGLKAKGDNNVTTAKKLVTPIVKNVKNMNEVGKNSANGNSPISLFQPLWIASLASATIILLRLVKCQ